MKLDVSSLFSGAMTSLPFSFSMKLSEKPDAEEADSGIPHLSEMMPLTFSDVRFPAPVAVEGVVVSEGGYVLLKEDATVAYETRCARCLAPISGTWTLHVEKPVAQDRGETELVDKENDDYLQTQDGFLNPCEAVTEALMEEFPARFLCREDCAGICPGCGVNLNEASCSCRKAADPRFASLSALLETMPDEDEETDPGECKEN